MNWQYCLNALDFDDHFLLDKQIQAIPAIEQNAFVFDRQLGLSWKRDVPKAQLTAKAGPSARCTSIAASMIERVKSS
jgi:hypothetical protein